MSPATRERVLAAAQELDYVMSPSASRLASGVTRSVGVAIPNIGRHFFAQVLSGAEVVLRDGGYDVLLDTLPENQARAAFFEELPLRRRVDAVTVVTLPLTEPQMDKLRALEIPLAVVGSIGLDPVGVSRVGIDDTVGARTAVNHLVNLGHERIAMIGGAWNCDSVPFRRALPWFDGARD